MDDSCYNNLVIETKRLYMCPFMDVFVEKYHKWLLDEKLREETNTEPMTLDDVRQVQRQWWNDSNVIAFILLLKPSILPITKQKLEDMMIGDVNLFLHTDEHCTENLLEAELSIMIAESQKRMLGYASEAFDGIKFFLEKYIPSVKKIIAKVNRNNTSSCAFFHKIGFHISTYNAIFNENEYIYNLRVVRQQETYEPKTIAIEEFFLSQIKQ